MNEIKKYAIIGALVLHAALIATLLLFKLDSFAGLKEKIFLIEFEKEALPPDKKLSNEELLKAKEILEQARQEVKQMLSAVPKQETQNADDAYSPNKNRFEKKVFRSSEKDELSLERVRTNSSDEVENSSEKKEIPVEKEGVEVMSIGMSRVIINLENRYKTAMVVPVFTCEEGGEVWVEISVSRNGDVLSANIIRERSKQSSCLISAARESALNTTFNMDEKAPKSQKGSIRYIFAAQ